VVANSLIWVSGAAPASMDINQKECPKEKDAGWVTHRRGTSLDMVTNLGTGEVRLYREPVALALDEEGDGYVYEEDKEDGFSDWCSEIFSKSLHRDLAKGKLFLKNGVDGRRAYLSDMALMHRQAKVLEVPLEEEGRLRCEVYITEVARGKWRLRWALPHLVDAWFGSARATDDWWMDKKDMLKGLVGKAGYDNEENFLKSTHALTVKHWHSEMAPPTVMETAMLDQEHAVTPPGLVGLMSELYFSKAAVAPGHPSLATTIRKHLRAFVKLFAGQNMKREYTIDKSKGLYMVLKGDLVSLELRGNPEGSESGISGPLCPLTPPLSLGDAILKLVECARRPSKCSFSKLASNMKQYLLDSLAADMEIKVDDKTIWDVAGHLQLKALGSVKRARRTPQATKLQAAWEAARAPGVQSSATLIAAQRVLTGGNFSKDKKKRKRGGALAGQSSALKWCRDNILNRMAAARHAYRDTVVMHAVLDGSTVFKKKLLVVVSYDPAIEKAFYCPQQADC
jgi:hypothetical protein